VPTFCRHNRFVANCPICSREAEAASPSAPAAPSRRRSGGGGGGAASAVRIRQGARRSDDGYRSDLLPGVRVREDARKLAAEIGFAAARLEELATSPPGLYAEVASEPDAEEATWLAFQIAYFSPAETDDPFASLRAIRTSWASGELPETEDIETGPRSAHDPGRGAATLVAYRRWAERAGSQGAAVSGEASLDGARRFERTFERLALPGLHRPARIDFLVTLARAGRYDLRPNSLMLRGAPAADDASIAAKRVFGIGDPMLIDRRAAALAEACEVPLEALDLALYNWQVGEERRATLGAGQAARAAAAQRGERVAQTLGASGEDEPGAVA
jgi:hypothetical protein